MPSFFHHLCKLSGCHEVPVTTNGRRYGLLPFRQLAEAPAPTEASGLPTSSAVGDYVVRKPKVTDDPAKLTGATTIELDELDVVN